MMLRAFCKERTVHWINADRCNRTDYCKDALSCVDIIYTCQPLQFLWNFSTFYFELCHSDRNCIYSPFFLYIAERTQKHSYERTHELVWSQPSLWHPLCLLPMWPRQLGSLASNFNEYSWSAYSADAHLLPLFPLLLKICNKMNFKMWEIWRNNAVAAVQNQVHRAMLSYKSQQQTVITRFALSARQTVSC